MAQIYTVRFTAARFDVPGAHPIFTVPTSGTWILRDLVITNIHTASQLVRLYVTVTGLNYDLFRSQQMTALSTTHVDLRQELLAGEVVTLQTDLGPGTALLTGYHFVD